MLTRVERALRELRAQFQEMPDSTFDLTRTCHVTGLDEHTCAVMLSALEGVRFIRRDADGAFRLRNGVSWTDEYDAPFSAQ